MLVFLCTVGWVWCGCLSIYLQERGRYGCHTSRLCHLLCGPFALYATILVDVISLGKRGKK